MDTINVIIYFTLIVLALYLFHWIWRYCLKPYWIRQQLLPKLSATQILLYKTIESIYSNTNSRHISHQAQQHYYSNRPKHFTYGEIDIIAFLKILDIIKPKSSPVIYDLGCGTGKAVFTLALTYNSQKIIGVELLPPLHEQCLIQQKMLLASPLFQQHFSEKALAVTFLQADLLTVDISDADIVFINATAFRGGLWDAILQKLQATLPTGSTIILTSHTLPHTFFKPIYAGKQLMSWGLNSLYIYEKI